MKSVFRVPIFLFLSLTIPSFAATSDATCAALLAVFHTEIGKQIFGSHFISPARAAEVARRLAVKYAGKRGLARVSPSNRPLFRESGRKPSEDPAVSARLLGIAEFFETQSQLESRLDIQPEDPGYWETIDGFALEVNSAAEAHYFIDQWKRQLAVYQMVERLMDWSTSPARHLRVCRWILAALSLFAAEENIRDILQGQAVALTLVRLFPIALSNDNWLTRLFTFDSNVDRLNLNLVNISAARNGSWVFNGTNGRLPIGVFNSIGGPVEAETSSSPDEELEIAGNFFELLGRLDPPSYIDQSLLQRFSDHTQLNTMPTFLRGLQRLWGRFDPSKAGPETSSLQVDFLVERELEEFGGDVEPSVFVWFRRLPH